jgi:hypothetical protein
MSANIRHQNWGFLWRLVQLIRQGARENLNDALECALGNRELPGDDLVAIKACPSHSDTANPFLTSLATTRE